MNKKDTLESLKLADGAFTILKDESNFAKQATGLLLNGKQIICELSPKFNGYQIHHSPTSIEISGVTPASIMTAIFELKDQAQTNHFKNCKQEFLFKTRFFKK